MIIGSSSSSSGGGKKIVTQRINWPVEWHMIVVSPQYTLSTPAARKILPAEVKLGDAVHNLQKTALLVAAVARLHENEFQRKKFGAAGRRAAMELLSWEGVAARMEAEYRKIVGSKVR